MKKMKLFISTSLSACCLLCTPAIWALSVINNYSGSAMDFSGLNYVIVVPAIPKASANPNVIGSCEGNTARDIMSFRLHHYDPPNAWSSGIADSPETLCLKIQLDVQQPYITYTNPLQDVPSCIFEMTGFVFDGTAKRVMAKATPECKFVGLCYVGVNPSNGGASSIPYDSKNEICCPTGHWKNGQCSAF
jgi:hypothetical protein